MATLLAAVEATLLGKYLAELETLASANRHGQQRSLQQPLSVPDFTRQVERRLRDAGHAEAPIPCADWVAFQFHPRRPTNGIASCYTGRWAIKLQVLHRSAATSSSAASAASADASRPATLAHSRMFSAFTCFSDVLSCAICASFAEPSVEDGPRDGGSATGVEA